MQSPRFKAPNITLGIEPDTVHRQRAVAGANLSRSTLRRQVAGLLHDRKYAAEGQHRVCFCMRTVREGQAGVNVYRTVTGKSRYTGLIPCGDVWTCPECAAKIAAKRAAELERALVIANLAGHHAYLLTLTFPHEHGISLADLLGPFAKALQTFKNSKGYKGFMLRHRRLGQVKALEVKHGGYGWHPHVHELIFAAPGMLEDTRSLDALRRAWVDALLKWGLGERRNRSDMLAHAFDLRGGNDAAAYIAKYGHDERWGMSHELAAPLAKAETDPMGHHTPFQLAALGAAGEVWAADLFREYVAAMKGKRAMTWTRGLRKALFGIDNEETDEALAKLDEPMPEEKFVGMVSVEDFQELLARRKEGDLLYIVGTWIGDMSEADLAEVVEGLISSSKRRSSGFLAQIGYGLKKLVGLPGQFSRA